jgi:hypothetical protein
MAAWVEDGVEVFLPDAIKASGLVELSFRSRVLLEPLRKVSAEFGFVALGIKRWPAASLSASNIACPISWNTT